MIVATVVGTSPLHNDGLDRSDDLDYRHDRKIDKLASAIAAMNTAKARLARCPCGGNRFVVDRLVEG